MKVLIDILLWNGIMVLLSQKIREGRSKMGKIKEARTLMAVHTHTHTHVA